MGGTPVLQRLDWAVYEDGTESGSVIIGSVSTNPTKGAIVNGTTYLARFGLHETSGNKLNNFVGDIMGRYNSGSWFDVNASSSYVRIVATANIADGDDTTRRLGSSYTYITSNAAFDEVDGLCGGGQFDPDSSGAECLFAFEIVDADVSDADTIELELFRSPDLTLDSYSPTGALTITVDKVAGSDIVKVIDEAENADEIENHNLVLNRLIAEVFNPKETAGFGVITAMVLARIIDENENIPEAGNFSLGLVRLLSETVNIDETNLNILAALIVEVISETVNSSETEAVAIGLARIIDEVENVNEVIVTAQELVRLLDESLNIQETILATKNISIAIDEILNIAETSVASRQVVHVLAEVLNSVEDAVNVLAAVIIEVIDETVNLNETNLNVLAALIVEIINEVENSSETTLNTLVLSRVASEVVNSSETALKVQEKVRLLYEQQSIVENSFPVRGLVAIINETLNIVEDIIGTFAVAVAGALRCLINPEPLLTGVFTVTAKIKGLFEAKPNE